jgi:large conductance mechanosensitive channel
MLDEFKKFLLRGNVVDLAVGVVIGAAFGSIVTSLVTDILTPLIGAIFTTPDFSNLSLTINGSALMYGKFLNALISFLMVSASIFFFVIKPMNFLIEKTSKAEKKSPSTHKCQECLSEIPIKAKRCAFCSQLVK